LLLASYRSEYDESSICVDALRASAKNGHHSQAWHELAIEPLGAEEARRLAFRLLGGGPGAEERAERIARGARGLPYFVGELTRLVQKEEGSTARDVSGQGISLDEVIWRRCQRLAPEMRHLLEIVATASRPILLREACEASGLGSLGARAASALRAERLLRGEGHGPDAAGEGYHDRIRETLLARVGRDVLRSNHDRLAVVLGKSGQADPETLAVHYLGAERTAEAVEALTRAAELAAEALAFDRAAKLYR